MRKVSTVSSGSQSPVSSNAFWPASTSFHATALPCLAAAASRTSLAAGQMSTPVPSPSMKGMIGWSVTWRAPSGPWVMRSDMRRQPTGTPPGHRQSGRPARTGVGRAPVEVRAQSRPRAAVDLARRARPVERVEVEPGYAGVQQLLAELGGAGHTLVADGLGSAPPVGRLEALDHPAGHRRAHRPPCGAPSSARSTGMIPGSTGLSTPRSARSATRPMYSEASKKNWVTAKSARASLAARWSRSVARSAESGWPAGWAATPTENPPMAGPARPARRRAASSPGPSSGSVGGSPPRAIRFSTPALR